MCLVLAWNAGFAVGTLLQGCHTIVLQLVDAVHQVLEVIFVPTSILLWHWPMPYILLQWMTEILWLASGHSMRSGFFPETQQNHQLISCHQHTLPNWHQKRQ
jgi:hypothetical protein